MSVLPSVNMYISGAGDLATSSDDDMSAPGDDDMSISGDDDDIHNRRQFTRNKLHSEITGIRSAGSFATFGTVESFANPGITIDCLGLVRLPLGEADARILIQESHQVPCRQSAETLIDESVAKTWEINKDKVRFLNPGWQGCLGRIVENVAESLGVVGGSKNVKAEFNKILLSEKGAMFEPHKDTEEVSSEFATLVICLPSEHRGGSVNLQHGTARTKKLRYSTGSNSAFNLTYIAWYADVSHEIEPIESGFRWILTYNLINEAKQTHLSASVLDSQFDSFMRVLKEWRDSHEPSSLFAYVLGHQYTMEGLQLAQLKGDDYYRVGSVAQSCKEQNEYFVLLANMEMVETFPDSDEPDEDKKIRTILTYIGTLEGANLTRYDNLEFPASNILGNTHYACRNPDAQWGGENFGNLHTDVEKFYKDSVMIVVPKRAISSFLIGDSPTTPYGFYRISKCLRERIQEEGKGSVSKEILYHICNRCLSASFSSNDVRGIWLGKIAVIAADLGDAPLFTKALQGCPEGFHQVLYSELGQFVCHHNSVIPDLQIIESLQKCQKLHRVYENVQHFYEGFCRGNPDRNNLAQIAYMQLWLDAVIYESLHDIRKFYIEDSATVIAILKRSDSESSLRQYVLYQGVKAFVDNLVSSRFPTELIVMLLKHSDEPCKSQIFVRKLTRYCLEPAILDFNLQNYITYGINRRYNSLPEDAGPVKTLFEWVKYLPAAKYRAFLENLSLQASELSVVYLWTFFATFLETAISVLDASTSGAQVFVQTLLVLYLTKCVGFEPAEPLDWARPEETSTMCSSRCDPCFRLDEFLRHPEAHTYEFGNYYAAHLGPSHYDFTYFEVIAVRRQIVAVKKTKKRWRILHSNWEIQARQAQEVFGRLPQDKLKRYCAELYDDIVGLRMLKTNYATGKAFLLVPQKRPHSDLD